MKWGSEIDGELVNNGWCWQFPGWQWVADRLNEEFGNNRTAQACRMKCKRALCDVSTEGNKCSI